MFIVTFPGWPPSLFLCQFHFSHRFTLFSNKIVLSTRVAKHYNLRTWKGRVHGTCRPIDLQRGFALETRAMSRTRAADAEAQKLYGVPQGPILFEKYV